MKLIVNADDFGLSPEINKGIIMAYENGIVSSTTIMSNMEGYAGAVQLARGLPGLGVGVHVNLTSGRPVSFPGDVPGLVDDRGIFVGHFWNTDGVYEKHFTREEVRAEVFAQVEKVLASGLRPTHLDAHHHVHCHDLVQEVMVEAASIYGLPVRQVDEKMKARFTRQDIRTPDRFVPFFGEHSTAKDLALLLKTLAKEGPGSIVEMMTHPGYDSKDPGFKSRYTLEIRQKELTILCSPGVRNTIDSEGIVLVDFRALKGT